MRISEIFSFHQPDDVRQMLNLDQKSGVRTGKCAKEMVGQTQDIALSNMDSQVVLSIHVHLFFERVEKSMECSVCMLMM